MIFIFEAFFLEKLRAFGKTGGLKAVYLCSLLFLPVNSISPTCPIQVFVDVVDGKGRWFGSDHPVRGGMPFQKPRLVSIGYQPPFNIERDAWGWECC